MSSTPEALRISLLGEFGLTRGSFPITTVNTARLQSLLAYLLVHRYTAQPRRHMAFLFWPDSTEAQAQSNFRNLLLALRRNLPHFDDHVRVERQTLQWSLDYPFELDIAQFQAALAKVAQFEQSTGPANAETAPPPSGDYIHLLRNVVDSYAGDLLPSCYDEWVAGPREQLRQDFLTSLQKLVNAFEKAGELGPAILYAQRLVRHDTLREENYRGLMKLHLANGDPAGAIDIYRHCVRVLKRDLNMEPSRMTQELARKAEELSGAGSEGRKPVASGKAGPKPGVGTETRPPVNLPAQVTSFIGREREVLQVTGLLRKESVRLVTLTGTAGTGKTRLAIKAAADLAASRTPSGWLYPDGVYFVSLAPVEDAGLVETSIARAVGVTETSGQSLHTSLIEYLGSKQLLLLLDNFEHLLPAAPLVGELLAACPNIKAFVTSRATLNLRGEHEYPLPAMTVPGHDIPFQPEDLAQFESVALFIVRALEVLPSFSVTRDNARALAEICRRLDGLPLAIELAATRVKVLSPEAILSRLDRRLRLLVGGRLDMPSRQQALETAISWSYNLLDQESKALYRGLSIFAGGFTLRAAEEILDGSHTAARPGQPTISMLDGITSLVNKSLLVHSDQAPWAEDVRFTMLETLREYGLERLEESGEVESVARRHALYFATLSETALRELRGPRQVEWMRRIELEHDNMRSALRWAIKQEEAEIALRLAGSLGRFWEIRGFLSEGRSWLRAALDLKAERVSPYRALALYCLGSLAVRQRDYSTARPLLEESIGLYREQGDKIGLSNVLNTLAVMTVDSDYEEALALHEESLALRRDLDDKTGIASSLHNIAFIKVHQGNWDEAYSLATELHTRWQDLGSTYGVSHVLYLLGLIATGQENYQVGERHLEECLELCAQIGDEWLAAWALHGLGELLCLQNKYDQANEVFARAEKLFAELGDELGRARTLISQGREAYRVTRYDEARRLFRQALQIGRKLDNHIVIGCCMAGFGALAGTGGELSLSARLFGCASDLLLTESTSLRRCAMTLNMEDFRSALEATDPGEWQTIFDLGGFNRWEETAAITPDMAIA